MKYAIYYESGMFLENDQWVESETNESLLTNNIYEAVLYDDKAEAEEKLKYEKEMGYNCKVVEVELKPIL